MSKRKLNAEKVSKQVGLNIRAMRLKRGWTLEETEEHGWPSWTHLQRIEAGKNITLKTLIALANLFGVSPKDFFD